MANGIRRLLRLARGGLAPTGETGVDFRALTEHSTDVVLQVTPEHVLRYVSPSVTALLGWTPEEMIQQQILVIHEEDLPGVEASTTRLLAGLASDRTTFRVRHKDGSIFWVECNVRRIQGAGTSADGDLVVTMRDISQRKALEDRLEAMAFQDELTGLANRRSFDETLDLEWRRTLREDGELSLLLLDLDHFKGVNDRYGHQVGDDCLRAVARVVDAAARRAGDLAARYGGEELALILPHTDHDGATRIGEEIRTGIKALRLPNGANPEGGGWLTASIGAATAMSRVGGTVAMPEGLLMAADKTLYQAKREGRDRVVTTMLLTPRSAAQGPFAA